MSDVMNINEAIASLKSNEAFKIFVNEIRQRKQNAMDHLVVAKDDTFQQFQGGFMALDSLLFTVEKAEEMLKLVADNAPKSKRPPTNTTL